VAVFLAVPLLEFALSNDVMLGQHHHVEAWLGYMQELRMDTCGHVHTKRKSNRTKNTKKKKIYQFHRHPAIFCILIMFLMTKEKKEVE